MEIQLYAHRYPEALGSFALPAPLISGTLLGEDPAPFKPTFPCVCRRELYDGGLCQPVRCICDQWIQRFEDNSTLLHQSEPLVKCQSKGFAEEISLESVTFGVFSSSIPQKFKQNRTINYMKILQSVIKPFFIKKLRCLEEGVIICYGDVKFKALSCYPQHGIVVRRTRLHLYTSLSLDPVTTVEIIPLPPHIITDELFDSVFLPYFTSREVHLHSSQHLSIYGLECIVTKTEPADGFVVQELTEFNYCENPASNLTRLSLCPYIEDMPSILSKVNKGLLISSILDFYVMPYFKGWRRLIRVDSVIDIGGIDFKVIECSPDGGMTDENTTIYYNGSAVSRRRHPISPSELHQLREIVSDAEELWKISKEKAENLPDFTLNHIPESVDQKICVICLTEFEPGIKIRVLPCCILHIGHIFHKTCSDKWLGRHSTCPTCKTAIIL